MFYRKIPLTVDKLYGTTDIKLIIENSLVWLSMGRAKIVFPQFLPACRCDGRIWIFLSLSRGIKTVERQFVHSPC